MVLFHGGCHGCTMQEKNGLVFCTGCQYFEGNWKLPDLNDNTKREEDNLNKIRAVTKMCAIMNEIIERGKNWGRIINKK